MPILPRATTARRYLLGSGLWLLFWGLFVTISSLVFEPPDEVYRVLWLFLGALLIGRGVQKLLRARKAPKDPSAPTIHAAPAGSEAKPVSEVRANQDRGDAPSSPPAA
ncbi:MAG TPA: hypothetical protein VFK02_19175 [Kofleriaceae bacterium]|nr:hypothetical protein [Kofleriaceae bacterium]